MLILSTDKEIINNQNSATLHTHRTQMRSQLPPAMQVMAEQHHCPFQIIGHNNNVISTKY